LTTSKRRRKLGQHFLADPEVIDHIGALIRPRPDQTLVEIGPGYGALTRQLIRSRAQLHAIEIDPKLVRYLQNEFPADSLILHHTNALNFDLSAIAQDDGQLRIVGNLPYSISTPLLLRFADYTDVIQDMCLMVQYEVATRLTAECGTHQYGRLTVCVARSFTVESVLDIEPDAFSPPPKVRSSMIVLRPKLMPATDLVCERVFADIVRLAFGKRRKTLRNALAGVIDEAMFEKVGVNSALRAQNMSVKQYIELARCVVSNAFEGNGNRASPHD